jgi:CRP-like cAMP-binding protein
MSHVLRQERLFSEMSESERSGILSFMHERTFEQGKAVFLRGQAGDRMFVVLRGSLAVMSTGKDDGWEEVERIRPGEVMGEMFCIDPAPHLQMVLAVESTTVLELNRNDFSRLRQTRPRSSAALVAAVFRETLRQLHVGKTTHSSWCDESEQSTEMHDGEWPLIIHRGI